MAFVEYVQTAELQGTRPRWIVLVNGYQWGLPSDTPDRSGAYDRTFPSRRAAVQAYASVASSARPWQWNANTGKWYQERRRRS